MENNFCKLYLQNYLLKDEKVVNLHLLKDEYLQNSFFLCNFAKLGS